MFDDFSYFLHLITSFVQIYDSKSRPDYTFFIHTSTQCLKDATTLARCNFDLHPPMLIFLEIALGNPQMHIADRLNALFLLKFYGSY